MWLGIPKIKYHWHGEWADPTIEYEGEEFSEWTVVEALQQGIEEGVYPEGYTIEDLARDDPEYVTDILDEYRS